MLVEQIEWIKFLLNINVIRRKNISYKKREREKKKKNKKQKRFKNRRILESNMQIHFVSESKDHH